MPLLVDDTHLIEFRPTKDVDIVVQVITLAGYYELEERLRAEGFRNDMSEGAPICRWKIEDCILDVMPVEGTVLGLSSRWFADALKDAQSHDLGREVRALLITPPYFIATKLAAFTDRGQGDFAASHDLEDIITLIDGRARIVEEMRGAPTALRAYVAETVSTFLGNRDFLDALPGHFPMDSVAGGRRRIVLDRLQQLSE